MRILKHPAFEDVTREVADDMVQDWEDQGWVLGDIQDEAEPTLEPAE